MIVEAIEKLQTYEGPHGVPSLRGERISFYGLVDKCEPYVDVIKLFTEDGQEITTGVYAGYLALKHEGLGKYRIQPVTEQHRTGEPVLIPAEPMYFEKIGKVYDHGRDNERIEMK